MTERTALRRHSTGRICHFCGAKLRDTIVHFGEKGCLEWPLNWQGAIDAGKATDCIVCLGSSLKVNAKQQCYSYSKIAASSIQRYSNCVHLIVI